MPNLDAFTQQGDVIWGIANLLRGDPDKLAANFGNYIVGWKRKDL